MSRIHVDDIYDKEGTGSPSLLLGVVVTGVCTATSFSGTVATATNAQGLTGTPDITVGSVTVTTGTFSGNVSVGGTLTYEDVSNVDSVGLITARTGIKVLAGGIDLHGQLKEQIKITAGKLSDNLDINIDNGMGHLFTTTETTTATPNIVSTAGINTDMSVGDVIFCQHYYHMLILWLNIKYYY